MPLNLAWHLMEAHSWVWFCMRVLTWTTSREQTVHTGIFHNAEPGLQLPTSVPLTGSPRGLTEVAEKPTMGTA